MPADQQNPQSRFPVIVSLDKQYLNLNKKKYKVKSGQSVSVNFIVRKKRLITFVFTASNVKVFSQSAQLRNYVFTLPVQLPGKEFEPQTQCFRPNDNLQRSEKNLGNHKIFLENKIKKVLIFFF